MNALDALEIEESATEAGDKLLVFTLKDRRRYKHTTLAHAPVEELARAAFEVLTRIEEESEREKNRVADFYAGVQIPAPECGCTKKIPKVGKTLGVVSLVKAMLGGAATPEVTQARLAVCQACQAIDLAGARLHRIIDGKEYCGVPRLSDLNRVYRNEAEWGCGCELKSKAGMTETECPLRKW